MNFLYRKQGHKSLSGAYQLDPHPPHHHNKSIFLIMLGPATLIVSLF